jgi:hypothetical protein
VAATVEEPAMQPRGGPPRPVGAMAETAAILAQARERAGRAIPERTYAPAPPVADPPPPSEGEKPATPPEETPLERFERLAEAFRRKTGFLAPGKDTPTASFSMASERERADRWTEWLAARRKAAAVPPPPPPSPSPGNAPEPKPAPLLPVSEPSPNSPADIGFRAPAPPRHLPKRCTSCQAEFLWAQTLVLDGDLTSPTQGKWIRARRSDDKGWSSMPVDYLPDALKGNVVLFDRPGEGIVCRVFKDSNDARAAFPGAARRTSHFATCPNANQHRQKPRR